ncbi:MAG: DUF169 domain-containing protein [Promethearchaeota archaeon]
MNDEIDKFSNYGKIFEKYIRPATFPLAIKLIKKLNEIPEGTKRPNKDLKIQNFLCQNFKMSRSYGWTIAILNEDCSCKVARGLYKWDLLNEESKEFSDKFSVGLYAKDIETSEKFMENFYFLPDDYIGLVVSPLTRTKVVPDIVQIYCTPAQVMRLIQSYLYIEGGVMEFTAAGRVGSCHEGVIKPFLTKKPQLVMLGNGDRVWGGAEESEVMFAIPNGKLDVIKEGLEATHKAGLRYPIPKYMNYEPGFQSEFKLRAEKRAGGTIIKEK